MAAKTMTGNSELKFPNRMFWTTYKGIAVLGLTGFITGVLFGTGLIVFRGFFEPLMPAAFLLMPSFVSRHSHLTLRYKPENYLWIVGFVYALSALSLILAAFAAYSKLNSDRTIDNYLLRKQTIDRFFISKR